MPHVRAGAVRLYYEQAGAGLPLVLLPGLGMRVEQWVPHFSVLAAKRRVIALDLRGGVDSDSPPGPYETRQMAADTALALTALGIERADVVGFSMGGFVAQWLAVEHEARVRHVVLAMTALRPSARGRERLKLELCLRDDPALRPYYYRELFLWMLDDSVFEMEGAIDLLVESAAQRGEAESRVGLHGRVAACLGHDATGWVGRIRAPALVVGGTRDLVYPPRDSRALAAAIPGAELALLESAHVLSSAALRIFDETVVRFLDRAVP